MKPGATEYPSDAAEMARVIRQADDMTAVRLLQVWGAKQRVIGARSEIKMQMEAANAQA